MAGLPKRIAAIAACGVPDTLVHGDFHPGNVVGPTDAYVLLDWGDSFVGNPLIDELAFTERLDAAGSGGRGPVVRAGLARASHRGRTRSVRPTCCGPCCPFSPR